MSNEILGNEKWVTFLVSILLYFIYIWGDTTFNDQKINFILNKKKNFIKWGLSYVFNYGPWPK